MAQKEKEKEKIVKILDIAELVGEAIKLFPPLSIAGSIISGVSSLAQAGHKFVDYIKSKQGVELEPMGA